jgi:ATP/maltotriose-dependent transcriptional regulator MalT
LKVKRDNQSAGYIHVPLLITKMRPPATASIYSRPRLLTRLDIPAALTLITAPAGCGKTVLLCDWMSRHAKSTA